MTSLRIEHYETVSKLGSGGSAEVYVARDTRTGDHVALKLFTRGTAVDRRRFERECSLLAQLELPSYARHLAHGVWIAEGMETRWLAMEWVQGPTLAQLFKERSLSVHESLELVGKVARAVAELHRRGIVHRDLKPHNVILRGGDLSRPVLLDLGIARVEGEELTQLGALLGTIGYMAPEQVRGEPVDARADVFSLGVLLFRSIAGVMPFAAEEQVSVLLRIAFEVAPRLSSRVPDVPPSVDQVAATLLAHQREDRPEDAGAAATLLEEVVRRTFKPPPPSAATTVTEESSSPVGGAVHPASRTDAPTVRRASERRLAFLVLARPVESAPDAREARMELRSAFAAMGLELHCLLGGPLALLIRSDVNVGSSSGAVSGDAAVAAGRAALLIRGRFRGAQTTISCCRVDADGRVDFGEVAGAAKQLFERTLPTTSGDLVVTDPATARLLADRFVLRPRESGAVLVAEHRGASLGAADQAGSFVGRERELRFLLAFVRTLADARVLVVSGQAGVGKSRLVRELLDVLHRDPRQPVETWVMTGDPLAHATPFSLLAPFVYARSGALRNDDRERRATKLAELVETWVPAEDAPRVSEFLREIVAPRERSADAGAASAELRAARSDPALMSDQLRRAVTDLVHGAARHRPILILVEDAQWADAATTGALLHAVHTCPNTIGLISLTRPDGEAPLLAAHPGSAGLSLVPLQRDDALVLARELLGPPVRQEAVEEIVDRAGGNPFFIEELARAVKAGDRGKLPDTVALVVEARMNRLSAEARVVLRFASVFGLDFWESGLRELAAPQDVVPDRPARGGAFAGDGALALAELEREGFLRRRASSRYDGQIEWTFRQRMFSEVAYDGLSAEDRARTHRLAVQWLERVGEGDPTLLALHYERAGLPGEAACLLASAAHLALEATDLPRAVSLATKAYELGLPASAVGSASADEADARLWLGDNAAALTAALRALKHLPTASPDWCRAARVGITASTRTNAPESKETILDAVRELLATGAMSEPFLTLLSQCAIQVVFEGNLGLADELLRASPSGLSSQASPAMAWLLRARAWRALCLGDPALYGTLMRHSAAAFDAIGDVRNSCVQRVNEAYAALLVGRPGDAVGKLRAVRDEATRLGLDGVTAVAEHNLGYALWSVGELDVAREVEARAAATFEAQADHRMASASFAYLALIEIARDELDEARRWASTAVQRAPASSPSLALALAVQAAVGLASDGPVEPCLESAEEAARLLSTFRGVDEGDLYVRVTQVVAHKKAGNLPQARALARTLFDTIQARAAKLSPVNRASFLRGVPEVKLGLELHRELCV